MIPRRGYRAGADPLELAGRAPVRAISFKNTALFKRGIWLSAAALLVFVAAPSALDGELWRNPLPSAIAVGILCAALLYFFWNTQIHRLADEVLDCGDRLKVRRGRIEESDSAVRRCQPRRYRAAADSIASRLSLRAALATGATGSNFCRRPVCGRTSPAIKNVAAGLDRARAVSAAR